MDSQVIVCHYPGHDELWARFDESSVAEFQAERAGSDELFLKHYFDFPDLFM